MNTLQIKYFLTLAECKSFQSAAEELYVSRPAVSAQILKLEEEWGFRIFERKYNEAILTPGGQNMYYMLKQAVNDYGHALRRSQQMPASQVYVMYAGVPEYMDINKFTEVIKSFQKENPGILVQTEVLPSRLVNFTTDFVNRFDVVVNAKPFLADNPFLKTYTFTSGMYVFLIPEIPGKPGGNLIEELSGKTIYVLEEAVPDSASRLCRTVCSSCGVYPKDVIEIPNLQSMLAAAKINEGVIFIDNIKTINSIEGFQTVKTEVPAEYMVAWRKGTPRRNVSELAEYIAGHI